MILTKSTPFYTPQQITGKYANTPHSKPDTTLPEGAEVTVLKYNWDSQQEPEERQFWAYVQYPVREEVVDGTETRLAWIAREHLELR